MKPDIDRFLEVAGVHLLLKTGAAVGDGYEKNSVMLLGIMMGAVREECERAASRRVGENRALRELFGRAVTVVSDPNLALRLERESVGEDENLLISALDESNAALRTLLIELHAHVEELESDAASRLNEEIWRELVVSTERRALALGTF